VAGSQAGNPSGSPVNKTEIEIRRLTTLAEFSEVLRIQRTVWGYQDSELLPRTAFVVANKIGGRVWGAYQGAEMVGFCMAVPGLKPDGRVYLHSHMLGVLPAHRDSGAGRLLKLEQRSDSLARGIELIEWTFDPLEIKNAYFNIERLGVIVRHYLENAYGATSSPLHGGLPTDRCVAEWWIESGIGWASRPVRRIEERIAVPSAIAQIRREDPTRARDIQQANAARFQACFEKGLAVIGFERGEAEGVYLLGEPPLIAISTRAKSHERIREIEAKALRNLEWDGSEPAA
jgi:predicted GNAT superfamily acetyltransferase